MRCLVDFLRAVYIPLAMPSLGTVENYTSTLRVFDRWNTTPWQGLTPEKIGEYLAWLIAHGRTPDTAAAHRRVLRAVLGLAVRRKLLALALDEIPRPKRPRKKPRAWALSEFERLVAAARSLGGHVGHYPMRQWFPAVLFSCYSTDWRIGCVMRLKSVDVNLGERWARSYESKTHEERFAHLTDQCAAALAAIWCPHREEVFGDWPYDRWGRQWKCLNKVLAKCIRVAGVPDIGRFHAIRKTATTLVASRQGMEAAARFAGHPSVRTTANFYVDESQMNESPPDLPPLNLETHRQLWLF